MITFSKDMIFACSETCDNCGGSGRTYTSVTDSTTGEEVDVLVDCGQCNATGSC